MSLWSRLFRGTRPARRFSMRPQLETLEARLVPAAGLLGASWNALAAPAPAGRQEVVILDPRVPDLQVLVADARARQEQVFVLDPNQDGVAQIAADLRGLGAGPTDVHILSHGAAGVVQLGATLLTDADFGQYAGQWRQVGAELGAGSDLLLYGCDVAQGTAGAALVQDVAGATGATVAASTDPTGAAAYGGDWTLEYSSGVVRAAAAFDAATLEGMHGTLTLMGYGDNGSGQLNIPAAAQGESALAAGASFALALVNGTVVAWGNDGSGQTDVPAGLSGVTAIAAGGYHSLALKSDGTVVAWGNDGSGQTDVPQGLTGVTAIAAGRYFSLALKSDGTVAAWGNDGAGQTDVPQGLSGVTAIAAGGYHALALKAGGTVVAWGNDNSGQTDVPKGLSGVGSISAGLYFSVALGNGGFHGWGNDGSGQLDYSGGGETVVAGGYHTVVFYPGSNAGGPLPGSETSFGNDSEGQLVNLPSTNSDSQYLFINGAAAGDFFTLLDYDYQQVFVFRE